MDEDARRELVQSGMTKGNDIEGQVEDLEYEFLRVSRAVFGDKSLGVDSMNDRLESIESSLASILMQLVRDWYLHVGLAVGLLLNMVGLVIVLIVSLFR